MTAPAYDRAASLPDLLARWVRWTPSAGAVRDGDTELSYRALDLRANAVAHQLVAHGVRIGQRVGLCGHRGVEAVVAMVGILKAGAAYVPLDADYPAARLAMMAEDTDLSCVVEAGDTRLSLDGVRSVAMAREEAGTAPALTRALTGADLAYVMFTSGSTGRPKAVGVPHRAVSRLVVGADYVTIGRDDTMLHHSSLSFDASTFELWGALLGGARLVVAPQPVLFSPDELHELLHRESVTVGFLTAAVFHQLAAERPGLFGGMHTLIVGGDVVAPAPARSVLADHPPRRLLNGYGPTENTVFSTTYLINELPEDAATVPIGFPIANTTCCVLRPDGGRAAVGERGELAVGGDGLAVGYLNDPALTAARFVPNPFGPGRLYRTGDVCAVRPDGAIEFHGRLDTQVKLHGHRVEPAEVESALRAYPGIADVVVTKQRTSADEQLVAHVVAASDREPPGAQTLSGFLRDRLPRYAVPAIYRLVDRIPLTAHGKVDRSALPESSPQHCVGAPGDTLMDQVRAVWLRTLLPRGLTPVIEADSTLFDVGGTSFDVLSIHGELAATFDVAELTPIDLFTYPTLRGYAAHLADLLGESPDENRLRAAQ